MATKAKAAPKAKAEKATKPTKAKATPKAKAVKVITPSTDGPSAKDFDAAFARWKAGGQDGRVCVLAKELGIRRGALRRQLRKRAGGREEFKKLRTTTNAGGVRASMGERAKSEDWDKGALVIPIGGRDKWTYRFIDGKDAKIPIAVTHNKGLEYRPALASERADAVFEMANGLPNGRLKIYTPKM